MSPPLLPQDITMTSETEETVLAEAMERLQVLENACEQLALERSLSTYNAILADGSANTLIALDNARRGARDFLRNTRAAPSRPHAPPGEEGKEDVRSELELRLKLARAGGADVIKFTPEDVAEVIAALSRAPGDQESGVARADLSPASRSQTPLSAGWQDISTAPKDGTPFTSQDRANYGQREFTGTRWYTHPSVAGWITDDLDCGDNEFEPTHWMLSGAQRSELTRLAQDEPISSPPSTGGEGEVEAAKARLAQPCEGPLTDEMRAAIAADIVTVQQAPSPEMGEISRGSDDGE